MKLSFSLPSSSSSSSKFSSSRPLLPNGTFADAGETQEEPSAHAEPEFVTVFDPTLTLPAKPASYIPPLPNTWSLPKLPRNLPSPPSGSNSSSAVAPRFELDTSRQPDSGGLSCGLNFRLKGDGGGGGENPEREIASGRSGPVVSAEQKFWEDMEKLPEDRGLDEFKDISVEEFGRAVLAGYGWKAGRGIGKHAEEDTHVRLFKPWTGTCGLGCTPEMAAAKKGGKEELDELTVRLEQIAGSEDSK